MKKQDLRIIKTQIALKKAMVSLLKRRSFSKIFVNDLCETALVSRTTFYVYYNDKYDLLKSCMDDLKELFISYSETHSNKQIIAKMNDYIHENKKLLINLVDETNSELMGLIINLLSPSLINILSYNESQSQNATDFELIMMNYSAGGLANLLLWQVRNNFPIDKERMTEYTFELQKCITGLINKT